MCYVHNQWYDISCATLYFGGFQRHRLSKTTPMMGDAHNSIKHAIFKLFSSCTKNNKLNSLISVFRCEVYKICALLGC